MRRCFTRWLFVLLFAWPAVAAAAAPPTPALRLVRKIELPGVEGRIDHMALDAGGNRLFVAALGNNSVEVVDLTASRRVHSIAGLQEPQGIAYLADLGQFAVASAGDGSLRFYDDQTYRQTRRLDFQDDADNVRYDPGKRLLYVGYGNGAIGGVDPRRGARTSDLPVSAHPESFQLERGGPRVFVNVAKAAHVAVLDRQTNKVAAVWPLHAAKDNFPMALDEAGGRLFVGARTPPKLLVLDTASGREIASVACVGDADDVFFDAAADRVYISGGEGALSVVRRTAGGNYEEADRIATAPGARTALFDPGARTLYLAVPHRGAQPAGVWAYQAVPAVSR